MAAKIDLKRDLDGYRARRGEFRVLDLPDQHYLMVDGHGDPNTTAAYAAAVGALYPVAYATKTASRRELGRDYVVPPLEGLWWAEDLQSFTTAREKSRWSWTLMILTPDWVDEDLVAGAVERTAATKDVPRLGDVRWAPLSEGRCVQTLHVGCYDDEGPVLQTLHERHIRAAGLRPTGRHHEIYLSDPRRSAPERLRTILRQPVAPS